MNDFMPEQAISRVLFSVSVTFYGTTIIHLRVLVTQYLLRPTQKLGRAALTRFPIRSCSRWGLPSFPWSPEELVRSYRTFSPLPCEMGGAQVTQGGIFSVALSIALPRLRVTEHPALWSSDFPLVPKETRTRAIVWPALTQEKKTLSGHLNARVPISIFYASHTQHARSFVRLPILRGRGRSEGMYT